MVTYIEIKGFDDFAKYTESINPEGPEVFFYFSGSKLPGAGVSWCPDCVDGQRFFILKVNRIIKNPIEMQNFFTFPSTAAKVQHKVKIHTLYNYEDFTKFVDDLTEKKHNVYFYFTGKKKENGRSWCIFCQLAEPVVKAYLEELTKNVIFVYVDVGDREYWKDKACPFRTDKRSKLMVIPTIIKWQGVQRLEGSQCNKRELLQMLFEDDD